MLLLEKIRGKNCYAYYRRTYDETLEYIFSFRFSFAGDNVWRNLMRKGFLIAKNSKQQNYKYARGSFRFYTIYKEKNAENNVSVEQQLDI